MLSVRAPRTVEVGAMGTDGSYGRVGDKALVGMPAIAPVAASTHPPPYRGEKLVETPRLGRPLRMGLSRPCWPSASHQGKG